LFYRESGADHRPQRLFQAEQDIEPPTLHRSMILPEIAKSQ